ncbi:MAG TPA: alanine--tRNA ligase, partial [Pyrinomonadaceae bacterium]
FFEMLGNFSFGDYFKKEAIEFAWDFLTNELKLDVNRLWFTYFEGDEEVSADTEARDLWIRMGAKPERVLPFSRKDNFWQMADTGPCGPNTEINYYLGDEPENPEKNRADLVNADEGDLTMEIWNLVFMQYNRVEDGSGGYKLEPLPAPSVDTGGGLERLTVVMEGVHSNYETSLVKPIINFIAELAGKNYEYESTEGFAMRVVADHARATAFSIADGILPGNQDRNYVLRKIMRRAIYHGREHLGFNELFFNKVCDFVVEHMREAYPELETQREFIGKMVRLEEEKFGRTLTVGLQKLNEIPNLDEFSELAKLYDTFGVPRDLIRVFLEEKGKVYEEDDFNEKFDKASQELQKQSDVGKTERKSVVNPIYHEIAEKIGANQFHGYETTQFEAAKIVALVKDDRQIEELKEGEEGLIVLSETPFYAEAGGQVGDTGWLVRTAYGSGRLNGDNSDADENSDSADSNLQPSVTADGSDKAARVKVHDTFSPVAGLILHKSKVEKGELKIGDAVTATVDTEKRDATRRNHTATHLVHAALKEVVGTHVKQAGSVVAPNYLRFDFTHYQALSEAEIKEIEDLVNRHVLENHPVQTNIMAIEEAMRTGAVALFGEKYGANVRVLSVGEGVFSKELCGGTHVRATGDIGSFKIISDEAIASGVRRIRAITGFDAFERFREDEKLIEKSLGVLRTQRDQLPSAIEKLQEELKRTRREVEELKMKIATGALGTASSNGDETKEINGVKVLAKSVEGLDKGGMRHLSDTLLAKLKSGVVILARSEEDKVSFIVRVSDDLTDKVKAGKIVQEIAPIVGGRGGGKPDMAEGGGTDASKLNDALQASYGVVEQMLG